MIPVALFLLGILLGGMGMEWLTRSREPVWFARPDVSSPLDVPSILRKGGRP